MQGLVVLLGLATVSLAGNLRGGAPRLNGRIVGGRPVTIEQYPYQLSLEHGGRHTCGASIISSTKALTAAHCVHRTPASSLTVRAGATYREQGGQVIRVQSISSHPSYNDHTLDYDIAVLHLAQSVTHGKVIPLQAQDQDVHAGGATTVAGWGHTRENGILASQLQAVDLLVVSHQECQENYKGSAVITARMICSGVRAGGKGSCQADSGGPLVHNGYQIGVVSFGVGCARPNYPAVYAKVSNLRNWIKQVSGV